MQREMFAGTQLRIQGGGYWGYKAPPPLEPGK